MFKGAFPQAPWRLAVSFFGQNERFLGGFPWEDPEDWWKESCRIHFCWWGFKKIWYLHIIHPSLGSCPFWPAYFLKWVEKKTPRIGFSQTIGKCVLWVCMFQLQVENLLDIWDVGTWWKISGCTSPSNRKSITSPRMINDDVSIPMLLLFHGWKMLEVEDIKLLLNMFYCATRNNDQQGILYCCMLHTLVFVVKYITLTKRLSLFLSFFQILVSRPTESEENGVLDGYCRSLWSWPNNDDPPNFVKCSS